VDEGAALEKRYTFTGIVGSNPTLSAILESVIESPPLTRSGGDNTGGQTAHVANPYRAVQSERCWSGRTGATGNRVVRETGLVGSNPTLSAVPSGRHATVVGLRNPC
jgi:hypothetical protein